MSEFSDHDKKIIEQGIRHIYRNGYAAGQRAGIKQGFNEGWSLVAWWFHPLGFAGALFLTLAGLMTMLIVFRTLIVS